MRNLLLSVPFSLLLSVQAHAELARSECLELTNLRATTTDYIQFSLEAFRDAAVLTAQAALYRAPMAVNASRNADQKANELAGIVTDLRSQLRALDALISTNCS